MQDALLTIHAIRHTYDPARPFGPWLAAVAKRRFMIGSAAAAAAAPAKHP